MDALLIETEHGDRGDCGMTWLYLVSNVDPTAV